MGRFKLKSKCGNHSEPNENGVYVTYTSGDIIESKIDLVKRFPNKFEKVHDYNAQGVKAEVSAPNIPTLKEALTSEPSEPSEPDDNSSELIEQFGEEITKKFPTAAIVNLRVFTKKKWCVVIDPEDNNIVLNEKKLREKAVEEFLKEYVQED